MDDKLITFGLALSFVITGATSCYNNKEGTCKSSHIIEMLPIQIFYSNAFISFLAFTYWIFQTVSKASNLVIMATSSTAASIRGQCPTS